MLRQVFGYTIKRMPFVEEAPGGVMAMLLHVHVIYVILVALCNYIIGRSRAIDVLYQPDIFP